MKILVLGGDGMLGHKMYLTLCNEFEEVFVSFHKLKTDYDQLQIFNPYFCIDRFDVTNHYQVLETLNSLQPDVVINCIGATPSLMNELPASDVIKVNSVHPHRLSEWCMANNKRFIHFSSDHVFSDHPELEEKCILKDAQDLYGMSKALGEVDGPGILTIRTSLIGQEIEGKTQLLEWLFSKKGQKVKGYPDVMFTGVTTNYMSKLVLQLINSYSGLSGIFQVASSPISKYDLLNMINKKFELDLKIKKDKSLASDKHLDGDRFFSTTGFSQPTWDEMIDQMFRQGEYLARRVA